MPGAPAQFTNETVIFVYGNSGEGKSTLCKFLVDDISKKHMCIDKFFSISYIEKLIDLDKYNNVKLKLFKRYLKTFDEPSGNISYIMTQITEKEMRFLSYIIYKTIILSFKNNDNVKLILLEGQPLYKLEKYIKNYFEKTNITIWNLKKHHF